MTATTFDATALRNALVNVEPHAEHNGRLPVLGAVRLEHDGATLTMITTDRYVMATETVEAVEAGDPFTILVSLEDVARLSAMLKGAPKNVRTWPATIAVDGDTVTVGVPGLSATCQTVLGEFPRWRTIFEGALEATADDNATIAHAAYNPQLLAKFAKVTEHGRKAKVLKMHFSQTNKPAVIEIGETFRAVLMPCRVEWPAAAAAPVRLSA